MKSPATGSNGAQGRLQSGGNPRPKPSRLDAGNLDDDDRKMPSAHAAAKKKEPDAPLHVHLILYRKSFSYRCSK